MLLLCTQEVEDVKSLRNIKMLAVLMCTCLLSSASCAAVVYAGGRRCEVTQEHKDAGCFNVDLFVGKCTMCG